MYRSICTDNEKVRADTVVEESYEKSYKFHTTILIIISNTLAESILIKLHSMLYLYLSSTYLAIQYLVYVIHFYVLIIHHTFIRVRLRKRFVHVSIKSGQRVKGNNKLKKNLTD